MLDMLLAYFTSPNLSNAVAGHNFQCWWPSHYWHAQFSLTTARLYVQGTLDTRQLLHQALYILR